MTIHTCADCGLVHDHGVPMTNAEVEIARINAESAVRIAQLQAGAEKRVAEAYAEADVESAKAEAKAIEAVYADEEADEHVVEAINAVAVGLDPAGEEAPPMDEMPMPEIVNVNENDDVTVPPHHEDKAEHEDKAPKQKSLFGNWS